MESNALIADGTSFGDVVKNVILKDIKEHGDLEHLVVNAHGVLYPSQKEEPDWSKLNITIHLGLGIKKENISEWEMRVWDPATCVELSTGEIRPNEPNTFWSDARYATRPDLAQSLRFNMLHLIYAP